MAGDGWIKAEHDAVRVFMNDVLPTATGQQILDFLRTVPADQQALNVGPRRVLFANAVWKAVQKDPRLTSLNGVSNMSSTIVRASSNCKKQVIADQTALFERWNAQHSGEYLALELNECLADD